MVHPLEKKLEVIEDTSIDEYSGSLLLHKLDKFQTFYEQISEKRKGNIHLISVIGGFYCLNLLPLFKPKKITLYDVEPYKIIFVTMILRAFKMSKNKEELLDRLVEQNYPVRTQWEATMRRNIAVRERGEQRVNCKKLRRTFSSAWVHALENFTATKEVLSFVPVYLRAEDIRDDSFRKYTREQKNAWLYTSNIFTFMDVELEFKHPKNAVVFAIYHHGEDFLDLKDHSVPVMVENKQQKYSVKAIPLIQ